MKILQVNCVYKTGSTGKIVYDIHQYLCDQGIDSVVCYGRGNVSVEPNVHKVCSEVYGKWNGLMARISGLMYGGCFWSTNRLISVIREEKPDIVHLHCINGHFVNIYRLIEWLKKNKIKTVLTLHAEFLYTANCGYARECEKWKSGCGRCPRMRQETQSWFFDRTANSWNQMYDAFSGFEEYCIVTSVSPWVMERAKQSPILENFHHLTVLNGTNTDVFRPTDGNLREKYKLSNQKIVLHVTPAFSLDPEHIKGGYYVGELAQRMPEIVFVVVGAGDTDMELPANVIRVGRVDDQRELAAWYSAADVTLLTSKRETFSMIVAESLCCGTPIVGFKAGAPEMIALPDWSEFVEHGDIAALENAVRGMLRGTESYSPEIIEKQAKKQYCAEVMSAMYLDVYQK